MTKVRPIICPKCKGQNWNIFRTVEEDGCRRNLIAKCTGCGATADITATQPIVQCITR